MLQSLETFRSQVEQTAVEQNLPPEIRNSIGLVAQSIASFDQYDELASEGAAISEEERGIFENWLISLVFLAAFSHAYAVRKDKDFTSQDLGEMYAVADGKRRWFQSFRAQDSNLSSTLDKTHNRQLKALVFSILIRAIRENKLDELWSITRHLPERRSFSEHGNATFGVPIQIEPIHAADWPTRVSSTVDR